MNVYESMRRILQYASDYLDIVPDTAANNADVTQMRQMLDAYDALAPDWANAPDWAQWYAIDTDVIGAWYEAEPEAAVSTGIWNASGHELYIPIDSLPLGIDWRLCKWSREGAK